MDYTRPLPLPLRVGNFCPRACFFANPLKLTLATPLFGETEDVMKRKTLSIIQIFAFAAFGLVLVGAAPPADNVVVEINKPIELALIMWESDHFLVEV